MSLRAQAHRRPALRALIAALILGSQVQIAVASAAPCVPAPPVVETACCCGPESSGSPCAPTEEPAGTCDCELSTDSSPETPELSPSPDAGRVGEDLWSRLLVAGRTPTHVASTPTRVPEGALDPPGRDPAREPTGSPTSATRLAQGGTSRLCASLSLLLC